LRFGGEKMPRYIEENEIYKLFNARGVAQLHVGDIDVLPRVEVKEVVHGWWLPSESMALSAKCSECKGWVTKHSINEPDFKFCPYCGAKMNK
jgi:DNA-directed RNA polymerase subunit RPC12/RpoP